MNTNSFFLKNLLLSILFITISTVSFAQSSADKIIGRWLNAEQDAAIEIYKSGSKYEGKLVWLKRGNNVADDNNPNATLKSRKLYQLDILKNFTFDQTEWNNGTIYDPKTGKTYSCKMWLENNSLNIRGYVGISLLGRTTAWTKPLPSHPAFSK